MMLVAAQFAVLQHQREKKDKKQILLNRYPLNNQQQGIDDPTSLDSHLKGLEAEMKKTKP